MLDMSGCLYSAAMKEADYMTFAIIITLDMKQKSKILDIVPHMGTNTVGSGAAEARGAKGC